jgi:SCY1-like protein 2
LLTVLSESNTVLNLEQYQRFMSVIRKLGERVEKEHNQFLRDSQRIEDRSGTHTNGVKSPAFNTGVDFESLVGRANGASVKPDTVIDGDGSKGWDDDVWGSIFNAPEVIFWNCFNSIYAERVH